MSLVPQQTVFVAQTVKFKKAGTKIGHEALAHEESPFVTRSFGLAHYWAPIC
jgi:hypothetical protein